MTDWIRFHVELTEGDKSGLSRATRFIYLELSRKARKRRGMLSLPVDPPLVDAIHLAIGGDKAEIAAAIAPLTRGKDPMIRIRERHDERVLEVVKWEKWNGADPTGVDRQRDYRERRKEALATGQPLAPSRVTSRNGRSDSHRDNGSAQREITGTSRNDRGDVAATPESESWFCPTSIVASGDNENGIRESVIDVAETSPRLLRDVAVLDQSRSEKEEREIPSHSPFGDVTATERDGETPADEAGGSGKTGVGHRSRPVSLPRIRARGRKWPPMQAFSRFRRRPSCRGTGAATPSWSR